MTMPDELREEITTVIAENDVVLFMKGNRQRPACGFSAQVVQILDGLLPAYATVDVLSSGELRDGIKEYSEWPTIPQLYVKGKFVGGCDIVKELYASGELAKELGVKSVEVDPPSIHLSESAARAFLDAAGDVGDDALRIEISDRFEHQLYFGPKDPTDIVVTVAGLEVRLDRASARRADGVSIDFVDGPEGAGFKIDNPNEPARLRHIAPAELKKLLDEGAPIHLLDVRMEHERKIARIEGDLHFEVTSTSGFDRGDVIVVYCHHGGRSQAAGEQLVAQGFRRVYNLDGGVDAWAREVDPSMRRY